ncbi:alpha/beta hydrolase [Cellvibrio sp. PSBB023]|nr:alpha/beta hydrolase [Cellvibrio sp. PSBB023]
MICALNNVFINKVAVVNSHSLPHLLLLPGLLHDARVWQHQTAGLANIAHVSVGDLTKATSIAGMAASVLSRAPAGAFALAGLSMGGYVALEMMRQAPERITGLALLDTSARTDTPTTRENRYAAVQSAQTHFQQVVDELIPKQLLPAHFDDVWLVNLIHSMANDLGEQVFSRQQHAMAKRINSFPFLHLIRCPSLVLCGREDGITPIGLHQEMVNEIPGAGLIIVNDSGHLSVLEQPLRVNEALSQWLAGVAG